MSDRGVNFDPFAQFGIPELTAGAASSSRAHAVESEELKYRQLVRTIQTICARLPVTELFVNLSCGHTVGGKMNGIELGCVACHKDVKQHSIALNLMEIIKAIRSIQDTTPFREMKDSMENLQRLVQDGATMEYLTDAVTLPCGHVFQSSTIAREELDHKCPNCRATFDPENIVPTIILQEIAAEFAKATKEEDQEDEEKLSLILEEQRQQQEEKVERFNKTIRTIDETILWLTTNKLPNIRISVASLKTIKQNILRLHLMIHELEERHIVDSQKIDLIRSNFYNLLHGFTEDLIYAKWGQPLDETAVTMAMRQFEENTLLRAEATELEEQDRGAAAFAAPRARGAEDFPGSQRRQEILFFPPDFPPNFNPAEVLRALFGPPPR